MVKGTGYFVDQKLKLEAMMSWPARQLIGEEKLRGFIDSLFSFMRAQGYKWAYVGREGSSVRVNFGRRRT